MESEKILLAITERRKWELREKEILAKLAEVRREHEEILRGISETKRRIEDLDAALSSKGAAGIPAEDMPSVPSVNALNR